MQKEKPGYRYSEEEIAPYRKGAGHSFVMALSTAFRLALGFIPQVIIAKRLGLGMSTDAYLMAFSINQIIVKLFRIGTLPKIFIMSFSDDFVKDRRKTERNISNFLNILFILSILVMFFVYMCAPLLTGIVAAGFSPEKKDLTVLLVRLLVPLILYQLVMSLGESIFKLHNEFSSWAVLSLLPPFFITVFVALFIGKIGIFSAVWGTLVGSFIHLALILYFVFLRLRYRFSFLLDLKHALIKKSVNLLMPYYASSVPAQIMLGVQSFYSSLLPQGLTSVFFYARRIVDYVEQFSVSIFSQIILPYFSRKISSGQVEQLKTVYVQLMRLVNYVHLPVLIMLAVSGSRFVDIFFSSKFTDAGLIATLGLAFSWLMVFILPEPSMDVQNNVVLAMKRTGWINLVNTARMLVVIVLSVVLFNYFGIWGIIFAYSCTYLQGFLTNEWNLSKRHHFASVLADRRFLKTIALNACLALFCFFLNAFLIRNLPAADIMQKISALAVLYASGSAFYLTASYFTKNEELKLLLSLARHDK